MEQQKAGTGGSTRTREKAGGRDPGRTTRGPARGTAGNTDARGNQEKEDRAGKGKGGQKGNKGKSRGGEVLN